MDRELAEGLAGIVVLGVVPLSIIAALNIIQWWSKR